MDFSDILQIFDIKQLLTVENHLLGQKGYIFALEQGVAYLYEETKGKYFSEIYVNGKYKELTKNELDKIHSLLRLQRIEGRSLKTKELWIYSKHVERVVKDLIDKRPELNKGNTHMAFAPKNYTRFSENLLFDFHYFYNDLEMIEIIQNFDTIYEKEIQPQLQEVIDTAPQSPDNFDISKYANEWNDGQIYRYLIDYIRKSRVSINGKISSPHLLRLIFTEAINRKESDLIFNFGPYLLFLSSTTKVDQLFPRKQNIDREVLEKQYHIIEPDANLIEKMFEIKY